jgi:hypothetical protein
VSERDVGDYSLNSLLKYIYHLDSEFSSYSEGSTLGIFTKEHCHLCAKNKNYPNCLQADDPTGGISCYLIYLYGFLRKSKRFMLDWFTLTFATPSPEGEPKILNFNYAEDVRKIGDFYRYFDEKDNFSLNWELFSNSENSDLFFEKNGLFHGRFLFEVSFGDRFIEILSMDDSYRTSSKKIPARPEKIFEYRKHMASFAGLEKLDFLYLITYRDALLRGETRDFSGIYLPSDQRIPVEKIKEIAYISQIFLTPIEKLRRYHKIKSEEAKSKKYSLLAAVAKIMSRNMSHQRGSHLLPGMTERMTCLEKDIMEEVSVLDNRLLDQLFCSDELSIDKFKTLAIIDEMGKKYHHTEQMRMDFLARISTQWAGWGIGFDYIVAVKFPFLNNTFVWQYLNISDGIVATQTKFRLAVFYEGENSARELKIKNGNGVAYENLLQFGIDSAKSYMNKSDFESIRKSIEVKDKGKSNFFVEHDEGGNKYKNRILWIRNGRIGVEAFYIILEGIIRNAVKHRKPKEENDELEVKVVLFDKFNDLSTCLVVEPTEPKNSQDFYYCAVTCNFDENVNGLHKEMQGYLNEMVVSDSGEIQGTAWGMKEIKIAACYLANGELDELNSTNVDYIFTGYTKKGEDDDVWDWNDDEPRLAYVFKIPRPKYSLVFSNIELKEHAKNALRDFGIIVDSIEDDVSVFKKRLEELRGVEYYFLCIDNNLKGIRNYLETSPLINVPKRIVYYGDATNLLKKSGDEIVLGFYKKWCELFCGNTERDIHIDFDEPSKKNKWSECGVEKTISFSSDPGKRAQIKILRHKTLDWMSRNSKIVKNANVKYLDCTSYSNPFFSFLYSLDPKERFLREFVLWQLWEMGNTSVIVMDERVADTLSGKKEQLEKLYWMGIMIVNRFLINGQEIWASRNDFEKCVEISISAESMDVFCKSTPPKVLPEMFDFFLIHQTRFDEIFDNNDMKSFLSAKFPSRELSKKLLVELLNDKSKWLVTHSGRGRMEGDLPLNTSFLEFSVIQQNIIRDPNKYNLLQAAFATV